MAIISVRNLTAGYGSQSIISRLSFSVGPGTSPLVLLGRNGSGKSTLLKALLGQISFEGEISIISDGLAWLPQHYQLSLRIPVLDFVAMAIPPKKGLFRFSGNHKMLAEQALSELGISHLANKQTDEISGGEWQLICLAQLVAQPTDVWLLDEPTAFLDIHHKNRVFNFLWEKASEGKTIVISTHDLPFITTYSGTYLYLNEDKAESGIMSQEKVELLINRLVQP